MQNKKRLIIISSPSGGGKSTMCKMLLGRGDSPIFGKCGFSVSATTRKMRTGEVHGVDYFFISKDEFEKKVADDEFLEWAAVFGNLYGTLKDQVLIDRHTIFDIDYQGQIQIKQNVPDAVSIFLMPPSIDVLRERLDMRGDLTQEQIKHRLSISSIEIDNALRYDFVVKNDNLETAYFNVCDIMKGL